MTVRQLLASHGLRVFDVERLPTHGGSLRIYACLDEAGYEADDRVAELADEEERYGIGSLPRYTAFQSAVIQTKHDILDYLITAKRHGKRIAAYGAPGKGNTLLNYCGIRTDFFDYAVDRNPVKQGTFTPGTRIPIYPPDRLRETKPDLVVIMPWNLKDEIAEQHRYIEEWGGRFVILLPEVRILREGSWCRP